MKIIQKLSVLFLVTIFMIIVSCEKESSDDNSGIKDSLLNDAIEPCEQILSARFFEVPIENPAYFTQDSVFEFQEHFLNSLGWGYDYIKEEITGWLLSTAPDSIALINVNENRRLHLFAGYSGRNKNLLRDSVLSTVYESEGNEVYASFVYDINEHDYEDVDSMILVNMTYVRSVGDVSLDVSHDSINNYLKIKSDVNGDLHSYANPYSAEKFASSYGHGYVQSMQVGVYLAQEIWVSGVSCSCDKQMETIDKVIELLAVHIKTGEAWEALVVNVEGLETSEILSMNGTASPFAPLFVSPYEKVQHLDSLYRQQNFGVISEHFQPYSTLYPDFDFIEAEPPF